VSVSGLDAETRVFVTRVGFVAVIVVADERVPERPRDVLDTLRCAFVVAAVIPGTVAAPPLAVVAIVVVIASIVAVVA
jgi:hypothetical protein